MASEERIKQLQSYLDGWVQSQRDATERRDYYLSLKALAVEVNDAAGADLLQRRAEAMDAAAIEFGQCAIRIQATLGRAQSGDGV